MYEKIFRSLWAGSLRGRAHEQLVFIYLFSNCDRRGVADFIHSRIADDIGLTVQEVREAIGRLEHEDPTSRSPDQGGRRIVLIDEHRDWGWKIVNYAYYKGIRDLEARTEQNRLAKQVSRSQHRSAHVSNVSHGQPMSAHVDVDVDVDSKDLSVVRATHSPPHLNGVEGEASRKAAPRKANPLEAEWRSAFDEHFWPIYPRRVGKAAALRAWARVGRGKSTLDELEGLLDAVCRVLEERVAGEWRGREPDKIPHPSTFLNAEVFE